MSSSAPPVSIDQVVSDFDGVTFHISTPEAKSRIVISISLRCFRELVQYGAEEFLRREYGPYIIQPENSYDFSIQVDLESLPAEKGGLGLGVLMAPRIHPRVCRVGLHLIKRDPRRSHPPDIPLEAKRDGRSF